MLDYRTGLIATTLMLASVGCVEERPRVTPAPVYEADVEKLLQRRCVTCHGADARGGVVLGTYLNALGCAMPVADGGEPVKRDAAASAANTTFGGALSRALERTDHVELLGASEQARLRAWIAAGLPLRGQGVHGPFVLMPGAAEWHGRLAARDHFGPLVNAEHPDACGRCHAGLPTAPKGIHSPAPGATPCTTCHVQPGGALACGTCHGDGAARAHPPRGPCLFPGAQPDAHVTHLTSTRLARSPLQCSDCHPAADAQLSGRHGDGHVELTFAEGGISAEYVESEQRCAVACHQRGGARPQPSFLEQGPLACGDCHAAPPERHYAGACDQCHVEVNAEGSALSRHELHMNGRSDVGPGDSDGGCGGCHGQADDPTPLTPSHVLHRGSKLGMPIECSDCHVQPDTVASPGHLDRVSVTPADVQFGTRARARGQLPVYAAGSCSQVACHAAGLGQNAQLPFVWDAPATQTCSVCHGVPPPPPHPAESACAASICHGSEVAAGAPQPGITEIGRQQHIDGRIQAGAL